MSVAELIDLTQLRTFVTVVQEGHLTRAAERLHISQPTASGHIRALEGHLGIQLFSRNNRALEPTAAGLRLAQAAARVLGMTLELASLANQLRGHSVLRVSVAAPADPKILAHLPALATCLEARHPMLELNLEVRNSLATKQGIRAGELDAGFFVSAALDDDMEGFTLATLTYQVAAPAAWAQRVANADWSALATMPWIVTHRNTSTADLIQAQLAPLGLVPRIAATVNHDMLLREMIRGASGIGLLRLETAASLVASGEVVFVPNTVCHSSLHFGYLRSRRDEPAIESVRQALRSMGVVPG